MTTMTPAARPPDDESIDFRAYVRIGLRSWWIFLLFAVGGAGAAFTLNEIQTPLYTSSARILVQGSSNPGTVTGSDIQSSRTVADSFVTLVTTRPIIDEAIASAGDPRLASKLSISSDVNMLTITATDANPEQAALIVSSVTDAFIADFLRRQFTQIAQFQATLAQYGLLSDPTLVVAQASTLTALSVVEQAQVPGGPSSPRKRFNLILGIATGLLLSFVFVLIREYYDDRVRSSDELRSLTGFATFGSVPFRRRFDDSAIINGFNSSTPGQDQQIAEAYKFIQTSIEFAAREAGGASVLLITSSGPGEGKSSTAANLAATVANDGKSVVLIDADLRRPTLHRRFGLENHTGLSQLLLGTATMDDAAVETAFPNLSLIQSGPLPPDPPSLLRSHKFGEVLAEAKARADLVLVDTAPILAVTDPMLIAAQVDGVILVVDVQATHRDAVVRSSQLLAQASLNMGGAVLNKSKSNDAGAYSNYRYNYETIESRNGWGSRLKGALRPGR
jgi:capsular exopolysaccharide synthesis family protein